MNNNKSTTIIDFISKQCKDNLHGECSGRWKGLGFEIICDCKCNHNKNDQALEQVEEPSSNTNQNVQPLSMTGVLNQENG